MIGSERLSDIWIMANRAYFRSKASFTRYHALAVQFRALEIMLSEEPEKAAMNRESAEFWQSEARRVRGAA